LCLGAANIASRAAFREVEDGVLWASRVEGVVAADIADSTPAAAVGIERGDLLLAINDRPIDDPSDVEGALREAFKMKDRLVFMDFITDQTENVFPMVPGGKGMSEMILSEEL